MSNHFHLLIQTQLANISDSMKFLNGTFTQYFNWTHQRVGHLYQGRFKSILVQESGYFRRLCRYIVMNPVKAGICTDPREYRWSSFNATMGYAPAPDFLGTLPLLAKWGNDIQSARNEYQGYVLQEKTDDPLKELRYRSILGDDSFIESLRPYLPEKISAAIARDQHPIIKPSLDGLLTLPDGLLIARNTYGYRMQEMASHLDVHPSSLSRIYKKLVKRLGSSPEI